MVANGSSKSDVTNAGHKKLVGGLIIGIIAIVVTALVTQTMTTQSVEARYVKLISEKFDFIDESMSMDQTIDKLAKRAKSDAKKSAAEEEESKDSATLTAEASSANASETSSAEVEGKSPEEPESSLFSDAEWVENETTRGVPVPSFSVTATSVDVSDNERNGSVSGIWNGVTDEEVTAYVQAVKDAGFINSANETKSSTSYSYSADNREDLYDFDYKRVDVTVSSVAKAVDTEGETTTNNGSDNDLLLRINVSHFSQPN